jgi:hypothetical protein
MANCENFESNRSAAIHDGLTNLSSYIMERSTQPQSGRDQHSGLVENGILPSLSFMSGDVRTGMPATAPEMKDSGVKVHHGKDGSTTGDYPSGVKVESTPASNSGKSNVILEPTISVESLPPNHMNKKGEVIDPKGRVLAKMNDDGSVTVDSGKGFYTQYPDGSINRESAIRTRDGKFEVIDTNTPLGNLRPGDMTKHNK